MAQPTLYVALYRYRRKRFARTVGCKIEIPRHLRATLFVRAEGESTGYTMFITLLEMVRALSTKSQS